MAVVAIVLAASIIPCVPMLVPPEATACQLCAEVPGTQVAETNPMVGTNQEMSPTSVEPLLKGSGNPGLMIFVKFKSAFRMPMVSCNCLAKAFSCAVNTYPPMDTKF